MVVHPFQHRHTPGAFQDRAGRRERPAIRRRDRAPVQVEADDPAEHGIGRHVDRCVEPGTPERPGERRVLRGRDQDGSDPPPRFEQPAHDQRRLRHEEAPVGLESRAEVGIGEVDVVGQARSSDRRSPPAAAPPTMTRSTGAEKPLKLGLRSAYRREERVTMRTAAPTSHGGNVNRSQLLNELRNQRMDAQGSRRLLDDVHRPDHRNGGDWGRRCDLGLREVPPYRPSVRMACNPPRASR